MIAEAITAVGNAISKVFDYATGRSKLRNADDVKKGKIQRSEAEERAKDIKVVAERDLEEIQKRASE